MPGAVVPQPGAGVGVGAGGKPGKVPGQCGVPGAGQQVQGGASAPTSVLGGTGGARLQRGREERPAQNVGPYSKWGEGLQSTFWALLPGSWNKKGTSETGLWQISGTEGDTEAQPGESVQRALGGHSRARVARGASTPHLVLIPLHQALEEVTSG